MRAKKGNRKWLGWSIGAVAAAVVVALAVLLWPGDKKDKSDGAGSAYGFSYEDFDTALLLEAGEQNLLSADTVSLSIGVPTSVEFDSLNIYNGGRLLEKVSQEALTAAGVTVEGETEYRLYTLALDTQTLPEATNELFVSIGDHGSNTLELFRPLALTEAELRLTYDTLCDLSALAGEEADVEALYKAAEKYLKNSENVTEYWEDAGRIFFTLTNGQTSYFAAGEADGTFSAGGKPDVNGPYTEKPQTVTGEWDMEAAFTPVQNPAQPVSTLNPKILVMAPVRTAENARMLIGNGDAANAEAEEELGREIAQSLKNGSCTVKVDGECDAALIQTWDQYGTVMMNVHGPDNGQLKRNPGRACDSGYFIMAQTSHWIPDDRLFEEFLRLVRRWDVDTEGMEPEHYYWRNGGVYPGIKIEYSSVDGWLAGGEIMVTTDHLMTLLADAEFENTVFVLNACNGLTDSVFVDFLLDHGASCVWGFEETINGYVAKELVRELDEYFLGTAIQTDYSMQMNVLEETREKVHALEPDGIRLQCRKKDPDYTYYGYTELTGTVTDAYCAEPVKDAKVNLYRYYNGKTYLSADVKTDKEGKYTITKVPYGIYLIETHWQDRYTYVNFSVGSTEPKVMDLTVERYTPIYTFEDLKAVSENMSGKYVLMADIVWEEGYGSLGEGEVRFKGVLHGNGHTVSNVTAPMFIDIRGGTVKELTVVQGSTAAVSEYLEKHGGYGVLACGIHDAYIGACSVSGALQAVLPENVGGNVGGFAGRVERSDMENCVSSVSISLQVHNVATSCGGMTGYSLDSAFTECENTGSITLTTERNENGLVNSYNLCAGGLSGRSGDLTLYMCENAGEISVSGGRFVGTQAGGLVASGSCYAERCCNSGNVSAFMPTASGLGEMDTIMQGSDSVGDQQEADTLREGIDNVNFMSFYRQPDGGFAGGLAASGEHIYFQDCLNTGSVSGSYCAGGIIAKFRHSTAVHCVNLGGVSGSFITGGFVGYMGLTYSDESLQGCYTLGPVGSALICGPFAGVVDSQNINLMGCYYGPGAGLDGSLMLTAKSSAHQVFSSCGGMESVGTNTYFDFENVWKYDAQTGALALR